MFLQGRRTWNLSSYLSSGPNTATWSEIHGQMAFEFRLEERMCIRCLGGCVSRVCFQYGGSEGPNRGRTKRCPRRTDQVTIDCIVMQRVYSSSRSFRRRSFVEFVYLWLPSRVCVCLPCPCLGVGVCVSIDIFSLGSHSIAMAAIWKESPQPPTLLTLTIKQDTAQRERERQLRLYLELQN